MNLYFRRFLALKVGAPLMLVHGIQWPLSYSFFSLGIAAAILVASLRKLYWPGLLVLFFVSLYLVVDTWPFTINHTVLETVILFLMLLEPGPGVERTGLSCTKMIQILMVTVWIYSGLQKIVHGYYATGEFLALETLSNHSVLGRNLGALLRGLESFFGIPGFHTIRCCGNGAIDLPRWEANLFRAMGVLTIATELFLPLTLLFQKTRVAGAFLLFLFQLTIGTMSGEIDFTFTAVAILLLFTPEVERVGYGLLAGAFLYWAPWY
jgi:hypothetical protein